MLLALIVLLSTLIGAIICGGVITLRPVDPSKEYLVLDLDDTLYLRKSNLGNSLIGAIGDFVKENVSTITTLEDVTALMESYYFKYGLTLVGLVKENGVKPDNYETYLDGRVDYSLVKADAKLRAMLNSAQANVIIFTNSGSVHTLSTLRALQIMDAVNMIIHADYTSHPIIVKPHPQAYAFVQATLKAAASSIYFVDDNERNVLAATKAGWNAARFVESPAEQKDQAVPEASLMPVESLPYQVINEIYQLPAAFPSLF